MRAWLAAAFLALAATQARAACQIHVLVDLPLEPDPYRALVKGAVNGQPVVFILDTGAWASAMPYPDAHRLGIKLDASMKFDSEGIGGRTDNMLGHFDMKLGQAVLPNEMMTVIDMHSLDHQAVALVGRELLGRHDLEINLPENDVRIEKVAGCRPAELDYWNKPYSQVRLEQDGSSRPAALVTVLLNGRAVTAMVDSGASQSVVTPGAAMTAGVDLAKAENKGEVGGIGRNRLSARVATFSTFTLGDETIKNAKLIVSEMWQYNRQDETGTRLGSAAHDSAEPSMLLGADFLRAHHVLIAYSMGVMVFSYMGGPVFDISQRREADRPVPPASAPGPAPTPAPAASP